MTLTEAAVLTKKALIGLGIFFTIALAGWLSYQYYYYNIFLKQPKPEEQAQPKFGLLPKLVFVTSPTASNNYTYSLDTKTGALPTDIPKIIKVYEIPQLGASLLASQKAKALAASFKFTNGPNIINPTRYQFTDDNNGQMVIDLDSGNFSFEHKLLSSDSAQITSGQVVESNSLPDETALGQDFKSFLQSKGILKELLTDGQVKVTYDAELVPNATHADVSIWESKIDDLPLVTPTFTKGLVSGTVTKWNEETQKYLTLSYTYWDIDKDTSSTYAIVPVKTAFDALKNGQAAIIVSPKSSNVSITDVYLAYYLPQEYQQYLQPVYVFEGPQFTAYVPAINPDYVQK